MIKSHDFSEEIERCLNVMTLYDVNNSEMKDNCSQLT